MMMQERACQNFPSIAEIHARTAAHHYLEGLTKGTLDELSYLIHSHSVTHSRLTPPPADPASHDPAEVRPESRADGGVPRQGDPTDRFMLMLERMTHLGMALTEDMVADAREAIAARRAARAAAAATPEPAAVPVAEPTESEPTPEALAARDPSGLAFHRLTRAVRLCMALAMSLHTERLDREAGIAKPGPATRQKRAPAAPKEPTDLEQIEARVAAVIERESEPAEQERLHRKLTELLEDRDIEHQLYQYSPDQIVAAFCRTLELLPDPAALEAESHPGWCYMVPLPPISPEEQAEKLVMTEIPLPYAVAKTMTLPRVLRERKKPPDG